MRRQRGRRYLCYHEHQKVLLLDLTRRHGLGVQQYSTWSPVGISDSEIDSDGRTGIDQLLRLDRVTVGFRDLFLEPSNSIFAVSVDLGRYWTDMLYSTGHTHLEYLLLQCFYRYLHYGRGEPIERDITRNHGHVHVTSPNMGVWGTDRHAVEGQRRRGRRAQRRRQQRQQRRQRPRRRPRWSRSKATNISAE